MRHETIVRLYNLDARVENLTHIGLMAPQSDSLADPLRELLDDFDRDRLAQLLGLTEEQRDWIDIEEAEEVCEVLQEIGKTGFLMSLEGRIYEQSGPESFSSTSSYAIEYAYAETIADLDAAINAALDRMEPRLREKSSDA